MVYELLNEILTNLCWQFIASDSASDSESQSEVFEATIELSLPTPHTYLPHIFTFLSSSHMLLPQFFPHAASCLLLVNVPS